MQLSTPPIIPLTGLVLANGTTATTALAAGTTGNVLFSNGSTWVVTARQDAMDTLAGTQSSGKYLRSDGTHTTLTTIQAADVPTLNQSTTGSAATLTTPRAIYGNNFDGSAALTGVIASTYGGTGNGFTKFSGPATTEKTFTLPNANATVLTDNAAVTVAQGGTGLGTLTLNNVILGNGTSTPQFVAPGTSGNVLTSNGTTWQSTAPSGGAYAEQQYYRHVGLGYGFDSSAESWFVAGISDRLPVPTSSLATGNQVIYLMPFIAPRGGTLDRIAIRVGTGATGALARLGIYANTSSTSLKPAALVLAAGEVDCSTTGVKSITISQAVTAGALYWLYVHANATSCTLYGLSAADCYPLIGYTSSLTGGRDMPLSNTLLYSSADPNPFTVSGSSFGGGAIPPAIFVRFSA